MEWYANKLKGWKNVSENCRLDAHTRWQGGYGRNYFRCRWNNCGKNLLFLSVLGNWIPCGYLEHFRLGKMERIKYLLFFFAENATEKIALCWIESRTTTEKY